MLQQVVVDETHQRISVTLLHQLTEVNGTGDQGGIIPLFCLKSHVYCHLHVIYVLEDHYVQSQFGIASIILKFRLDIHELIIGLKVNTGENYLKRALLFPINHFINKFQCHIAKPIHTHPCPAQGNENHEHQAHATYATGEYLTHLGVIIHWALFQLSTVYITAVVISQAPLDDKVLRTLGADSRSICPMIPKSGMSAKWMDFGKSFKHFIAHPVSD